MKFVIYNTVGEVLQVGDASEHDIDQLGPNLQAGHYVLKGNATLNDLVDPVTKTVITGGKPAQPSGLHDWDIATMSWVGNVERARAAKALEINRERDRRIFDVLAFDGINLDGDVISQKRLSDKLMTINERERLGLPDLPVEALVWKDADNIVRSFLNQADYKDFLSGFAVALDERGMGAMGWSWVKKAELAALNSFQDIQAYSPE